MKLVFATLIRVSVSELERKQLGLLRQELGIDPPPGPSKGPGKEVSHEKDSEVP